MSSLNIRVLNKEDWAIYKELRLLSLQDSPDSFGSSYEHEVQFPNEEWVSRLDPDNRAKYARPLIAELNGVAIGLAWGMLHSPSDKTAHIYQMWVSSRVRGQGVGRLLLNKIIEWAKNCGLDYISLAVTTTNMAAVHLYKTIGFEPCGSLGRLREISVLSVQPMRLKLCTNVA
ncbi:GNAT family N-acetyltransferase [Moritella sp. 5]|uniref:GNAT family N-acetyltransferase n=1 Tax=Moritella sp. 5 TaxID=2746231 RepID=UPI001BA67C77|nr:GNAT family N-acetyltransferase [Moritella sp. 5]QUM80726.1 GNAT family N-acetyltransferase [Moritella sp. 5]